MVAILIENLRNSESAVRQQAETELEAMGSVVIDSLVVAMRSDDLGQAWRAARLLARIDDPRRLDYMLPALILSNSLVGQVALKVVIASLPAEQIGPCLVDYLPRCHPLVQVHVVLALGNLHHTEAIPALMQLLAATESAEVRYTVIEALGLLNAAQSVELIRSFQHNHNHHVRERVQIALTRLGG